jgi:hypothetical protein
MKKITKFLILVFTIFFFNYSSVFAAASTSSGSDSNDYASLYKKGKNLVLRAKKL